MFLSDAIRIPNVVNGKKRKRESRDPQLRAIHTILASATEHLMNITSIMHELVLRAALSAGTHQGAKRWSPCLSFFLLYLRLLSASLSIPTDIAAHMTETYACVGITFAVLTLILFLDLYTTGCNLFFFIVSSNKVQEILNFIEYFYKRNCEWNFYIQTETIHHVNIWKTHAAGYGGNSKVLSVLNKNEIPCKCGWSAN